MLCLKVLKSATKEKVIAAATATGANNNDNTATEGGRGMQGVDGAVTADAYFSS
jgi:hypothetical protein